MTVNASEKPCPTPGHRVVETLGGIKRTAALAKRSTKSVYRWLQPVDKGGSGGLFPGPAQRRMVRNAQAAGLALAFEDFAPRDGEVVL